MKDDAPIILECPACETRYEVPVAIPEGGRKVRCARCANIWTVQPGDEIRPDAVPAPEEEEDEEGDVVFRDDSEVEAEAELPPVEQEVPPPAEEEVLSPAEEEVLSPAEEEWVQAVGEAPAGPEAAAEEVAASEPETGPVAEFDAGFDVDVAADKGPEAGFDAEFAVDSDDLTFAEAGAEGEPAPAVAADAAEAADVGSVQDEVAEFYGDQPDSAEQADAEAERIVIGKARRRLAVPGRLAAAWAGLILAVIAFGALAASQRAAIVGVLPGSAWVFAGLGMPVNVRGLDFHDVAYSWETDAGRVVLELHGDIVNITDRELPVPAVVFALRDQVDKEVYQWEQEVLSEPLAPRGRAAFAIRIPTPPKSIKSVQVRFAKAR